MTCDPSFAYDDKLVIYVHQTILVVCRASNSIYYLTDERYIVCLQFRHIH